MHGGVVLKLTEPTVRKRLARYFTSDMPESHPSGNLLQAGLHACGDGSKRHAKAFDDLDHLFIGAIGHGFLNKNAAAISMLQ